MEVTTTELLYEVFIRTHNFHGAKFMLYKHLHQDRFSAAVQKTDLIVLRMLIEWTSKQTQYFELKDVSVLILMTIEPTDNQYISREKSSLIFRLCICRFPWKLSSYLESYVLWKTGCCIVTVNILFVLDITNPENNFTQAIREVCILWIANRIRKLSDMI